MNVSLVLSVWLEVTYLRFPWLKQVTLPPLMHLVWISNTSLCVGSPWGGIVGSSLGLCLLGFSASFASSQQIVCLCLFSSLVWMVRTIRVRPWS